jgi:hypothetical protein
MAKVSEYDGDAWLLVSLLQADDIKASILVKHCSIEDRVKVEESATLSKLFELEVSKLEAVDLAVMGTTTFDARTAFFRLSFTST